jgi:hypothetical protein
MQIPTVEVIECPLCKAGLDKTLFFKKGHIKSENIDVTYHFCTQCGLAFQVPQWCVDYTHVYREAKGDGEDVALKSMLNEASRAINVVDFAESQLRSRPTSVLDIGSSLGCTLEVCKTRYGCDVVGVEPGDDYRGMANDRGIETVPTIQEIPDRHYDWIFSTHVLEHVVDPHLFVSEFPKADGLMVEVPNIYAAQPIWMSIWHVTGWSANTVSRLFEQYGWGRPKAVRTSSWNNGNPDGAVQAVFER